MPAMETLTDTSEVLGKFSSSVMLKYRDHGTGKMLHDDSVEIEKSNVLVGRSALRLKLVVWIEKRNLLGRGLSIRAIVVGRHHPHDFELFAPKHLNEKIVIISLEAVLRVPEILALHLILFSNR